MNNDTFMKDLIQQLSEVLETAIGAAETEAAFSSAGIAMGEKLHLQQEALLKVDHPPVETLPQQLRSLAGLLGSGLHHSASEPDRYVLQCCNLPPQRRALAQPQCRLMASLLGTLAARSSGYARVHKHSPSGGCDSCQLVLDLRDDGGPGHEYFGDD